MFFQPHIQEQEVPCQRLAPAFDGLSILHLSDLHITRWTQQLARWHSLLAKIQPHVLVITGDLGHRSWRWKESFINLQRLLEPLTPPLGTFFILGNHDSAKLGPALAQTTDSAGHPRILLKNQAAFFSASRKKISVELPDETSDSRSAAPVSSKTPRLALIGLHQHRRIDTDIPSAMRHVRPADFKLMLLHYPDLVHPAIAAGADVCLAGHTHGGQICWPDGKPLFRQDTLDPNQCTGMHRINGAWMIVNRGLGVAGLRVRLFCPPEALLLTLRSTKP